MKKNLLNLLIFVLISGCSKSLKKSNQYDNTLTNKDSLKQTVFFYDDSQDTVKTITFLLKNNYKLIKYPQKDADKLNTINFRLMGKDKDTIVFSEPISIQKYEPYYDETDFNDFFAIKQNGDGNTNFWLFEKKSGKEFLNGLQIQFDTNNQCVIYADESNLYKLFIFDIPTQTKKIIELPYKELSKIECIKYNYLWKSIYLKQKNKSFYTFGFKMCDSTVTFKLNR